ncbi:hypothetical protein F5J12DRAFT_301741 [Pisolithus orientalis]|uniref:uncharacterized protein n=1 Tax=Pisolithus orientalis TaxID=936130 RepID=UPI002224F529|nr:uncharacterized protein F5J12DRAFT_301741 [Pisolithus orientalis]KAI6030642.1 hypothetical protein F5J12DRAFT_301741 [Pisolithus orientalis]
MAPCHRCSQSHNSPPHAFLLTCRGCHRSWHHRCHIPPVEDKELIRRIHATTAGNQAEDLAAWLCKRCKKHNGDGSDNAAASTAIISSGITSATSASPTVATPLELPSAKKSDIIQAPAPPQDIDVDTSRNNNADVTHTPAPSQDVEVGNSRNNNNDDDIYGPPVERRVIRIFPSLAEELREKTPAQRDVMYSGHHEASKASSTSVLEARPTIHTRKRFKTRAKKFEGSSEDGCHPFFFLIDDWLRERRRDISARRVA